MNHIIHNNKRPSPFPALAPEMILELVEKNLGRPCSNLCRQLNSYINRVFELETVNGERLIVKFYRPERWSAAAIKDEHDFLQELQAHEVPVIAPMVLKNGKTTGFEEGLLFSIFPYCGGRSSDEFNEDQWLEIGRLVGRCHAVGATHPSTSRLTMAPDHSTRKNIEFILASGLIEDPSQARDFSRTCQEFTDETTPLFTNISYQRIHGDCHYSNIIYRPGESFYLIDFDDMVMGPAVQDLWMLLPGKIEDSLLEIDMFLEGYETFHSFDRRTIGLIEALRGMRFLHYTAWLTYQFMADGTAPIVPGFASKEYWIVEISDLKEQLEIIRQPIDLPGNF